MNQLLQEPMIFHRKIDDDILPLVWRNEITLSRKFFFRQFQDRKIIIPFQLIPDTMFLMVVLSSSIVCSFLLCCCLLPASL